MTTSVHDLSPRQLQYVVAVADTLGFHKAAEQCHVSQPTLSAQVKQLEDVLGVQLFERDRRRVLLTAAGRRRGRTRAPGAARDGRPHRRREAARRAAFGHVPDRRHPNGRALSPSGRSAPRPRSLPETRSSSFVKRRPTPWSPICGRGASMRACSRSRRTSATSPRPVSRAIPSSWRFRKGTARAEETDLYERSGGRERTPARRGALLPRAGALRLRPSGLEGERVSRDEPLDARADGLFRDMHHASPANGGPRREPEGPARGPAVRRARAAAHDCADLAPAVSICGDVP